MQSSAEFTTSAKGTLIGYPEAAGRHGLPDHEQSLPQFQMATGKSVAPIVRLGGASVWFIHNPNAISISYGYLVNVQQLVFQTPDLPQQ